VPESFAHTMWTRVQGWFVAHAEQVTLAFIADETGEPVDPNRGYLRIRFAEGVASDCPNWGEKRFPVLHGCVSLSVLGAAPSRFATFGRLPEPDQPISMLLPFAGGTVEVEAALYEAAADSPLDAAVDLVSGLASLTRPPLSVAAGLSDQVSEGFDRVLSGNEPVLGLHATMVSPNGGGSTSLRPGHLVLLGAPQGELAGTPVIRDGRLHLQGADGTAPPADVDYLVIRVECRTERDEWRFPELEALVKSATEALVHNRESAYADRRREAIARAWNSPDLIPVDRKRLALLISEQLDGNRTLDAIAYDRLRAPGDPVLPGVTLDRLLEPGSAPAPDGAPDDATRQLRT